MHLYTHKIIRAFFQLNQHFTILFYTRIFVCIYTRILNLTSKAYVLYYHYKHLVIHVYKYASIVLYK